MSLLLYARALLLDEPPKFPPSQLRFASSFGLKKRVVTATVLCVS